MKRTDIKMDVEVLEKEFDNVIAALEASKRIKELLSPIVAEMLEQESVAHGRSAKETKRIIWAFAAGLYEDAIGEEAYRKFLRDRLGDLDGVKPGYIGPPQPKPSPRMLKQLDRIGELTDEASGRKPFDQVIADLEAGRDPFE
jgi:hypothetical protein